MSGSSELDFSKKYQQVGPETSFKPAGLWYSLENEWVEWCESNMPEWVKPNHHILNLEESRLCVIDSLDSLSEFENEFLIRENSHFEFWVVDWGKVTKKFSGIEIRNYYAMKASSSFSEYRKRMWFNGLDVNGGCIWDLSCVKGSELVRSV